MPGHIWGFRLRVQGPNGNNPPSLKSERFINDIDSITLGFCIISGVGQGVLSPRP